MSNGDDHRGEARTPGRARRHPVLLVLVSSWIWLGCSPGSPGNQPEVRNLLLICFDAVRFDAFQAASSTQFDDPRARWVHRAVRLERTQSPAPWTVPAVASVLTGLDPVGHGAGVLPSAAANLDREVPAPISAGVTTLAERLQQHGFYTAAVVAHPWFVSGDGLDRGFASVTLEGGRRGLVTKAMAWLDGRTGEQRASRFFLYLHFVDSHGHIKWKRSEQRSRAGKLAPDARRVSIATAPGDRCADPDGVGCIHYLGYVQSIVEQLQSVFGMLEMLEESGLLSETLVMLYSDHGEEFSDHAEAERARGVDPRGIYGFGHGQSLYQELLHVPVWIWHPGLEGRTAAVPASLLDLMPTALEWLRLEEALPELDGRSLAGWLTGGTLPPEEPRPLYATRIAYGPEQLAVVSGPWKRIWYGASQRELFDLSQDPRERTPAQRPAVAEALDALLADYQARESVETAEPPVLSEDQLERLRSLGYLEGAPSPETAEQGDAESP